MHDKLMIEMCDRLELHYISDLRLNQNRVFLYFMNMDVSKYDQKELDAFSNYIFQMDYQKLLSKMEVYKQKL